MKSPVRHVVVVSLLFAALTPAFALSPNSAGDIVRAQVLISKVMKIVEKHREATFVLQAPEPIKGNAGQFLLPYREDGQMTEWAGKIVNVAASKVVGEKVGDKATQAVASKVPFGGLASGLVKKKSKEVTAQVLLGGPEFIKKTSELSFANLNDYAVYLHVRHSGSADYQQALAAAMALYPDLEGRFEGAIKEAYRVQSAAARKATAAAGAKSK